ncbi:Uu.00g107870.m01.CDS01 [Anthostomella pinea]|uniref:Endoplasmic reticulum junction formation protein lunapark n=1 Tax=Anthostomella pinea TaxID=933095 RepID=A0AAI8VEG1_9PEZI|nr:Uu.00g107870.m01.CDS01 [Anthostomella pinea]
MVSFWPWKGKDSSSPASFEKTLSTLSTKITANQSQLDRLRSNSRRVKVLWTLYLAFAYLVYAIVLTLVVGWKNLGPWEWTGMAGGPVVIYLIRTATNAYFSFRVDTLESRLKDQQAERAKTIQKLKDATRYDSTLELLEKYGGSGEKRGKTKKGGDAGEEGQIQQKKGPGKKGRQSTGRTNLPPPPTANIQRPPSAPGTPQSRQAPYPMPPPQAPSPHHPTEEFAPNAGPLPMGQYDMNPGPPRWYDRIMDLMLGEDETAPKNRVVLICEKCRLVNGQAPPGIKSLSELGTWKCMGCGAMNGEMDEGKKIMREVLRGREGAGTEKGSEDGRDSDETSDAVKVEQGDDDTDDEPQAHANMQDPKKNLRNKKSQMVP